MHAVFKQHQPGASGTPIRGTFYPSSESRENGSIGTMVPKLLAFLVAMAVLRTVVANVKRHRGSSGWSRRREAIASLHRDLHARSMEDATDQPKV